MQQESQHPSVMLPEHAFNLHHVPTDTSFSTDILAASEREAENAIACPVTSLLRSGTAFQNNHPASEHPLNSQCMVFKVVL